MRVIDVSKEDKRPTPKQAEPELRWVDLDQLCINEAYQRPIENSGWKNIRKIADNFHWTRFSPLLLAKLEDGRFAIIDGQHRAHSAAMCGIKRLPALVAEMSDQEQASAFSWVNGSVTTLTQIQVYRAALAAFEPWAVQSDAAVTKAGCKLMTFNKASSRRKPGEIFCISQIRTSIDARQTASLVVALSGLRKSANGEEADWYNSSTIRSLTNAVIETGVTRYEAITEFLDKTDLWSIQARVNTLLTKEEFRGRNFRGLFQDSLIALLRGHFKSKNSEF